MKRREISFTAWDDEAEDFLPAPQQFGSTWTLTLTDTQECDGGPSDLMAGMSLSSKDDNPKRNAVSSATSTAGKLARRASRQTARPQKPARAQRAACDCHPRGCSEQQRRAARWRCDWPRVGTEGARVKLVILEVVSEKHVNETALDSRSGDAPVRPPATPMAGMAEQASRRVQAVCPQLSDYTEAVRVLVSTKMERLSHLAFSGWQQHGPGGLLLQMPTPTIAACESLLASARSAADAELQREGGDEADLADTFAQFDPSRHFLVACQLWARGRSKRSHLWFDFSPG